MRTMPPPGVLLRLLHRDLFGLRRQDGRVLGQQGVGFGKQLKQLRCREASRAPPTSGWQMQRRHTQVSCTHSLPHLHQVELVDPCILHSQIVGTCKRESVIICEGQGQAWFGQGVATQPCLRLPSDAAASRRLPSTRWADLSQRGPCRCPRLSPRLHRGRMFFR